MRFCCLCICVFITGYIVGQDKKADSLRANITSETTDSSKAKSSYRLASYFLSRSFLDSANLYAHKSLKLSEKSNFLKGMAISYNFLGQVSNYKNKPDSAIYYFEKSQSIYAQLGDTNKVAGMYNNIGISYSNKGNLPKAMNYYFLALKTKELLHDSAGIANAMHNIGQLYNEMKDSLNSIKYFNQALTIRRLIKDEPGTGYSLVTIGLHYKNQKRFDLAKENLTEALRIAEKTKEEESIAIASYNLGSIYYDLGSLDTAGSFFDRSLEISRKNNDITGIALCLEAIATIAIQQNHYQKAKDLLEESYNIAQGGMNDILVGISKKLSEVYEKTGNYEKALYFHKISNTIKDSLFNEENVRKLTGASLKYEYEKEKLLAQKEQEKKEAEAEAAATKKNIFLGASILILILVCIFSFTIYLKLKENRRQKHIIEEQQKEMIDSINYAKRIQYALLAHTELLNTYLPEHFVLFKPKDIVSGDFYWATVKNDSFYLAVCDCTGHGVPGAFMSLLNINFLNEAIIEKDISEPGKILDHVREQLIKKLEGEKDGMDAVLFQFPVRRDESFHVKYAAANNSAVLVRNKQLIELKKDSMPIGLGEKQDHFTTHSTQLKKGDCLFLYTDGFADQFGGPKGKKFKYKQLDDLLVNNSANTALMQKQALELVFNNWKGELEQVDDVCVIGICV